MASDDLLRNFKEIVSDLPMLKIPLKMQVRVVELAVSSMAAAAWVRLFQLAMGDESGVEMLTIRLKVVRISLQHTQ